MSSEKETLATDLGIDGIQAWGRLYDTVSAKLRVRHGFPDGTRKSACRCRNAARCWIIPIGAVRRAAFDGGNAAWQTIEDTAAARSMPSPAPG